MTNVSSCWATLYLLMAVGMVMMGAQIGLSGTRHISIELALASSSSVVLFVIADLDRPQEGFGQRQSAGHGGAANQGERQGKRTSAARVEGPEGAFDIPGTEALSSLK